MVAIANHLAQCLQWTLNQALPHQPSGPPLSQVGPLKSVAVITPYFIGDSLLLTAFLQNLRAQLPADTPLFCIGPGVHLNLLETLPEVTACYRDPGSVDHKKALLKRLSCDVVFLMRYSLPWAKAMHGAAVQYRVGFDLERLGVKKLQTWGSLLTHAVQSGTYDATTHQLDLYHQVFTSLGWEWHNDILPHFQITPTDTEKADTLLSTIPGHPRIILHASAGSPGKRWPKTDWVELIRVLDLRYPDAAWITVGTAQDSKLYDTIQAEVRPQLHNLCGQTTLRQTAAVCAQSDLVITLDTAVAHLAAFVEIPSLVVLYGPTNMSQWRPITTPKTHLEQVYINVPCRPCLTRLCFHQTCLNWLTPQRVLHHVDQAIARNPAFNISSKNLDTCRI